MINKKNILIYSNIFPNPENMNKGIFIKQLTDSLCSYYNITVISPVAVNPYSYIKSLFQSGGFRGNTVQFDGYEVYYPRYLIIPKTLRSMHWLSVYFSTVNLVTKLHRKNAFDLISSHWVYPDSTAAVMIAKKLNIKVSVHALGCDINNYIQYFTRRYIIKKTLKNADLIITKSSDLKQLIQKRLLVDRPVRAIMNGVDKTLFKKVDRGIARRSLELPLDEKILLFVGNFQIEKGLEYLLESFSNVVNDVDKLHLYVIGGGELQSKVEKQIRALNINDSVFLLGKIDHSKLPQYFSAANYLCLPSLREGCPNVVIESLSCGTPVIASNVGAVPDIITSEKFGFIHDSMNVEQMSNVIKEAFNESYINSVVEFEWYSWDKNRDLIHSEFETLLNQ